MRSFFTELSHLTHLTVSDVTASSGMIAMFSTLDQIPTLKHLSVNLRSLLVQDDIATLSPHLHKVTALCFGFNSQMTGSGLVLIANCCSCLTELNASYCPYIRDNGVVMLMVKCGKTLRNLSLQSCNRITDTSLGAIAMYGDRLRQLDISVCERISVEGVFNLVQQLRRLKELTSRFTTEELSSAHEDLRINVC